ncbi:MAG: type II toxin-antitoxin system VapC family toxin [Pseudomonadota bacterium]
MTIVIDASVTLSWLLEDEAADASAALLRSLLDRTLLVPAIWSFEVPNVMLQAEKRGRITVDAARERLALLSVLEIVTADPPKIETFDALIALGRETRLSAYDAAYLDLALREGAPLASLDARLREAAAERGVEVWPE